MHGRRTVETRHHGNVAVREENAAAALEVMSRFAVDPRLLAYLPPTMAPTATSKEDGYLEHPAEAFAQYRADGVERVVCEEKHMGSRAVALVCRDADAARERFGADGVTGALHTVPDAPSSTTPPSPRRSSRGCGRRSGPPGSGKSWTRTGCCSTAS